MTSNPGPPLSRAKDLENLENSINQAEVRLEELGVAKDGQWFKALDDASHELKYVIDRLDGLESEEGRLKAWFDDIARIENTPCTEPGSAYAALEGMATTLGSFETHSLCLKEIEDNVAHLLETTRRCHDSFKQKFQLAQQVLAGVRQRRSEGDDEQLVIQPVSTLSGWAGDTACGTLLKMVEEKKSGL